MLRQILWWLKCINIAIISRNGRSLYKLLYEMELIIISFDDVKCVDKRSSGRPNFIRLNLLMKTVQQYTISIDTHSVVKTVNKTLTFNVEF